MAKRIIWTQTAQQERKKILEFWIIHNKSKTYSRKLSKQFKERTAYLSEYNYTGKVTDFKDVRVTLIAHFSIFYKIKTNEIIIVGLWDNRRNPDDLQKNLGV